MLPISRTFSFVASNIQHSTKPHNKNDDATIIYQRIAAYNFIGFFSSFVPLSFSFLGCYVNGRRTYDAKRRCFFSFVLYIHIKRDNS